MTKLLPKIELRD